MGDDDLAVGSNERVRPREYEALVLIGNGRSTLDHLVQALDVHAPQAYALVVDLERRGMVDVQGDWYTGGLCFILTGQGKDALQGTTPDGARDADTLRADEAAILDSVTRDGTLPDPAELHWHPSSTVQYLSESGDLTVDGMVRPRLSRPRSI